MSKYLLWCSCLICRIQLSTAGLESHQIKHISKCLCEFCKLPIFKLHQRFCNHSCATKWNNKKRGFKLRPIVVKLSRHERWIESWLSGLLRMEETYYGPDNTPSTFIRKYLINRSGNICEKCGWKEINQKTGKVPLQLNHIDGDSTNNAPVNVELICPNCHSLTPTFGRHGKGRKKRYAGLA